MASGDYTSQCHKYLPLAVLRYITTYHATHSAAKFPRTNSIQYIRSQSGPESETEGPSGCRLYRSFKPRTQILINTTKKNIMQSYLKYKEYYDRKAKAPPSHKNDYCFILQPVADHQGSKIQFQEYRWIGPYIEETVLLNENYIVRKLKSNKTQILHASDCVNIFNLTMRLSFRRMTSTSSRGKQMSQNLPIPTR